MKPLAGRALQGRAEGAGHRAPRHRLQRRAASAAQRQAQVLAVADRGHALYPHRRQRETRGRGRGPERAGTVDHVPVYPREVVRRALELNASAVILVHNHPSGDPTPSQADIEMTGRVRDAVQVMGITLHDHLIIGKSRELSFRSAGLL